MVAQWKSMELWYFEDLAHHFLLPLKYGSALKSDCWAGTITKREAPKVT